MKFFVKDFCKSVQARVFIFGMQVDNDELYRWIANQPSPLILPCICPIFFLSILPMMQFFVKDFCETVQARVVIFGVRVDNYVLYNGIANQSSPAYSSLYLSNFLSFHTLNDEIFRQRFLRKCAS